MNVLLWHVHGSWTTAFVQGPHRYLLPTLPDGRGGRPAAWDWPASAVEVPVGELAGEDVDVVVLQRPEELDLAAAYLGRTPGRDVAAVYLEHNTPGGPAMTTRHPMAGRDDLLLVHVTHFNALAWDVDGTPSTVVEHGVVDPGHRYTGGIPAAALVVNEPLRRGRVTGTDLLPAFAAAAPLDVFGMGTDGLGEALGHPAWIRGRGDLPQDRMHDELARRRVYLHPTRWTSLGLSLVEAMLLGMPVVALATTEAVEAVPPEAGCRSTDPATLARAVTALVAEPERAAASGRAARAHALGRYGLHRFLTEWDGVLQRVLDGRRRRERSPAPTPTTRPITAATTSPTTTRR